MTLQDIEYSDDNFFVPAIERLRTRCSHTADEHVADSLSELSRELSTRFPCLTDAQEMDRDDTSIQEDEDMEETKCQHGRISGMQEFDRDVEMEGESDSGSDGPVMVTRDEIEASFARYSQRSSGPCTPMEYRKHEREAYPLLFAAKLEHEDILMACSRILDDANDVSLVREAAAYLEEVEAKRK